jgi:hypothetical protein
LRLIFLSDIPQKKDCFFAYLPVEPKHSMRKDNEARKNMKMPSSRLNWFIFIASTSVLFDKTFVNSLVVSSGNPSGKKILKHLKRNYIF